MQPSIFIRGTGCSLVGIDDNINAFLEEKFSYEVKGFEYTDAYQNEEWSGKQQVYRNRHFFVGLLFDVVSALKTQGIETSVKDFRQLGKGISLSESTKTLRPYQKRIVEKAISFKASSIEVATGGGKTLIASEFIRRLGLRTLMIVPSVEIFKQTETILSDYLDHPIGLIGDKQHDPDFFTIATWQSLKDGYESYLNTVDVLIIDEAQHIGAAVLKKIGKMIPAVYRLGMSGTLFREDGADLEIISCCGPKIASVGYTELINLGYLTPAKFWLVRMPKKNYPRWTRYNEVYDDYVVNSQIRNETIINMTDQLVRDGRKVLVFVAQINHGKKIAEMGGHEFLYSTHPDRRQIIDDFRNGKTKCLVSTSVLNEGFDLPIIDAVILASPAKSIITTLQRIGRSLRPFENKKDSIIVDFADNCNYLEGHFKRRLARYQEERSWKIEKTIDPTATEEGEWF